MLHSSPIIYKNSPINQKIPAKNNVTNNLNIITPPAPVPVVALFNLSRVAFVPIYQKSLNLRYPQTPLKINQYQPRPITVCIPAYQNSLKATKLMIDITNNLIVAESPCSMRLRLLTISSITASVAAAGVIPSNTSR